MNDRIPSKTRKLFTARIGLVGACYSGKSSIVKDIKGAIDIDDVEKQMDPEQSLRELRSEASRTNNWKTFSAAYERVIERHPGGVYTLFATHTFRNLERFADCEIPVLLIDCYQRVGSQELPRMATMNRWAVQEEATQRVGKFVLMPPFLNHNARVQLIRGLIDGTLAPRYYEPVKWV